MALPKSETDARNLIPDAPPDDAAAKVGSVDRHASSSLSFATQRVAQPPFGGRIPVAVGPGRTPPGFSPNRVSGERVSEFPLQSAKVQRPALRAETLQRDRLLDWLSAQAESRVILVTADAGYGKTTLLADFTRRTRRRVLWYRIDANDRSWVSLVRYLVASGREVYSGFGATTQGLLDRIGTAESPSREGVIAALIGDF